MSHSPSRRPLHEIFVTDSEANTRAGLRLVPSTPPRLLGQPDVFGGPHPSQAGKSNGAALDDGFQPAIRRPGSTGSSGSSVSTTHKAHQPAHNIDSATGSPISKPKSLPKKRLHVHPDKTFTLRDASQSVQDGQQPSRPSSQGEFYFLPSHTLNAEGQSNNISSCFPDSPSTGSAAPATPASASKQPIPADPISSSPWNYRLVGGLRKVPKTPDLKQKAAESPLPPLLETLEGPATESHNLSTTPSFQSTETATSASENESCIVYPDISASTLDLALAPPSSSDSNYHLLGDPSPASSIIHRTQTSISENENYQLHGDPSPSTSCVHLSPASKYSQESLVVPPLRPRARRSNESLGYYKSRSRESLRTGSLTSISTVLSQQEASRAIVGTGSLIQLPFPNQNLSSPSSWAESPGTHPQRSHMNEHPHQWSSQLSTVHSVSDGGTDRGSRSWSDDNGRRSSGFPSTPSRHSRQVLSISSSQAQEGVSRSRSNSIEAPQPAFVRNGQRDLSSPSIRMVEDQDEYGDGITDLQDLRSPASRNRLSGLYSINSSDSGRTNTMRSTASSRANSLVSNSIPTWARLYYGSGERRYLGAPGSSTDVSHSRASSFRSGSPNTDHFPLNIYSPRRRPREINPQTGRPSTRGSLEISPAALLGSDGQLLHDPHGGRFRTWSMSSIWSPHLRLDRRATRRSVWEPPSVNWSTDGHWFGKRNIQIVMFIAGFIFPFAWIIAAFLPLPPNPMLEMRERYHGTSNFDASNRNNSNSYAREFGPTDETIYESAKWWRGLNRWMSLVAILIIAAIIVLVVLSIKQGW